MDFGQPPKGQLSHVVNPTIKSKVFEMGTEDCLHKRWPNMVPQRNFLQNQTAFADQKI